MLSPRCAGDTSVALWTWCQVSACVPARGALKRHRAVLLPVTHPGLKRPRLRALKSQRAALLPMARTGFGHSMVWVLPGPCRLAVLRQVTSTFLSKVAFKLQGVLLLGGRSTSTSRQWTHLNCSSSQRHTTPDFEVTSALLPVVHASTATPSALPLQTASSKPIPPQCNTVSGRPTSPTQS